MEPHTIDLAHDLSEPHLEGVYGPMLWVDAGSGRVWQEGSAGQGTPELGSGTNVLLVWAGQMVAVVSEGVGDEQVAVVSQHLRAFLQRPDTPIVFERDWLPGKIGRVVAVDAAPAVPARVLARAEGYVLIQARFLDLENVVVEVAGERFDFGVRTVPDAAGRLRQILD